MLVQEEIHSSKARGEWGMVINIDMENSFYQIRNNILLIFLTKFGVNYSFIH